MLTRMATCASCQICVSLETQTERYELLFVGVWHFGSVSVSLNDHHFFERERERVISHRIMEVNLLTQLAY